MYANRKTSVARNINDTGQMQTTSFSLGIWKKVKMLQSEQQTGKVKARRQKCIAFLNNKYRQQGLV